MGWGRVAYRFAVYAVLRRHVPFAQNDETSMRLLTVSELQAISYAWRLPLGYTEVFKWLVF